LEQNDFRAHLFEIRFSFFHYFNRYSLWIPERLIGRFLC
jgi:hypothetical protein